VHSHDTLILETEAAFTILGLLLVFLPMFLGVLGRAEGNDSGWSGPRVVIVTLAWSVPVLIILAALDATFGLFAVWGHEDADKPTALMLIALTWLVVLLAAVAAKLRAT
jgi:hypothetical protein